MRYATTCIHLVLGLLGFINKQTNKQNSLECLPSRSYYAIYTDKKDSVFYWL